MNTDSFLRTTTIADLAVNNKVRKGQAVWVVVEQWANIKQKQSC